MLNFTPKTVCGVGNMKVWWFLFVFAFFCSNLFADQLISVMESVRVRESPKTGAKTVSYLRLYEKVTFTGEVSSNRIKTKIGTIEFNEPFYKIKMNNGKQGWVFAGALATPYKGTSAKNSIVLFQSFESELKRAKQLKAKKHPWNRKKWYSFIETNNSVRVKRTPLEFISDEEPINHYGEVMVHVTGNAALFHLSTSQPLVTSKLKTVKNIKEIGPDKTKKIRFLNRRYVLSTFQIDMQQIFKGEFGFATVLVLRKREANGRFKAQVLAVSSDPKIEILWAGDINGDGLLDLGVTSDQVVSGIFEFYLSSAKSPYIVKPIAQATTWAMND